MCEFVFRVITFERDAAVLFEEIVHNVNINSDDGDDHDDDCGDD